MSGIQKASSSVSVTYTVLRHIPDIGAKPGDYIIVRPNDPTRRIWLHRDLSDSMLYVLGKPNAVILRGQNDEESKPQQGPGAKRGKFTLVE